MGWRSNHKGDLERLVLVYYFLQSFEPRSCRSRHPTAVYSVWMSSKTEGCDRDVAHSQSFGTERQRDQHAKTQRRRIAFTSEATIKEATHVF